MAPAAQAEDMECCSDIANITQPRPGALMEGLQIIVSGTRFHRYLAVYVLIPELCSAVEEREALVSELLASRGKTR